MSTLIRHLPWFIAGLLVALLLGIVINVATTMPPRSLTILTGPEGGGYYLAAQQYQRIAQEKGFDLQIRTTQGAAETLDLLSRGVGDVGFMQGGIARNGNPDKLRTIANVFYEPVWIFYRPEAFAGGPLTYLSQAGGKRIAVGSPRSGTRELAGALLAQAGLTPPATPFLELSNAEAEAKLKAGEIDAAIFVLSDAAELPWRLLQTPGVELMNMERAGAYAFHYPWLRELELPQGGADVALGLPHEAKHLLATTASLVARADLHPDLVRLLVNAAVDVHRDGGRFEAPNQFPNLRQPGLPPSPEAEAYLREAMSGQSLVDRFFPFWLASVLDRYLLFVIPALLLLVPLLARSPLAFQWYMRQRVVRWYRVVQDIERRAQTLSVTEIDAELARLAALDEQIGQELVVTNSFMPQVYELRQHIDFVARRLERRKAMLQQDGAAATTVPTAAESTAAESTAAEPTAAAEPAPAGVLDTVPPAAPAQPPATNGTPTTSPA